MKEAKEKTWVKVLRIVLYSFSIVGVVVGASLIKIAGLSASYANGAYVAKYHNGEVIFFVSLIVLTANIMWGIIRWFLRGYREKWKPGRIIGKLIGGGIWRTLAIVPLVLVSLLLIAPKVSSAISDNVLNKTIQPEPICRNDKKLIELSENIDNYSKEEAEAILSEYSFSGVDFGTDASSNISRSSNSILFQNASAYSSTVTVLNKATLSDEGHFVVFYTDTGDDKISDKKALELSAMLEDVIVKYKERMGLDYTYRSKVHSASKLKKMQSVLKAYNIDENILDTAMPVFVVNPYKNGSTTLAFYVSLKLEDVLSNTWRKVAAKFGDEDHAIIDSAPTYPFINIVTEDVDSSSLPIIVAHELGHHYTYSYMEETFGDFGLNQDDFIIETIANLMAINVLPNEPVDNVINEAHYNGTYLSGSALLKRIDEVASPDFLGYPAVAFLENYYEIVPDAKKILLDASYYGHALSYLYEKAGAEKYAEVMTALAEKNLTGEYDGKLVNTVTPYSYSRLECYNICEQKYSIGSSATKYTYISTSEYLNTHFEYESSGTVSGSLLGKKYDGTYDIIESGKQSIEYFLSEDTRDKYEILAFAVSNSSIDGDIYSPFGSYKISLVSKELEDLVADTGNFDFKEFYSELEPGCVEIDTDALFDNIFGIMNLGSNYLSIANINTAGGFADILELYNGETAPIEEGMSKAKEELSPYRITVCANYLNASQNFETTKDRLQSAMGVNFNILNETEGSDKTSIFVGLDPLTQSGKAYILAKRDGEMGLVTFTVSQK